jgi:hypothetical protein
MTELQSVFKHFLIAVALFLALIIWKAPGRNQTFKTVMYWIVAVCAVGTFVDIIGTIGGLWK